MLAFASTIHKSQGRTYVLGVLDLGESEGKHPGLSYTSLSRFKDPGGVYCDPAPTLERLNWARTKGQKLALAMRLAHERDLSQKAK